MYSHCILKYSIVYHKYNSGPHEGLPPQLGHHVHAQPPTAPCPALCGFMETLTSEVRDSQSTVRSMNTNVESILERIVCIRL